MKRKAMMLMVMGLIAGQATANDFIYRVPLLYTKNQISESGDDPEEAEGESSECNDPSYLATLDPGYECGDGTIFVGKIDASHFMLTTPSGCEYEPGGSMTSIPGSRFEASCSGGVDIVIKEWYLGESTVPVGIPSRTDGSGNTSALMSASGTYPAASYCVNMDYGGHSDWYLPSVDENQQMRRASVNYSNPPQATFNTNQMGMYLTSTESSSLPNIQISTISMTKGFKGGLGKTLESTVRCMRKVEIPSNFDCNNAAALSTKQMGYQCNDGQLYIGVSDYLTTPGNCGYEPGGDATTVPTEPFTPVCSGTVDTMTKVWSDTLIDQGASSMSEGALNSHIIATDTRANNPAVMYCRNLNYAGHNDWFLPAREEVRHFLDPMRFMRPTFGLPTSRSSRYSTSSEASADDIATIGLSWGSVSSRDKLLPSLVRCVRRAG